MLSTQYRLRLEKVCKLIVEGKDVNLSDMIWAQKLAQKNTTAATWMRQARQRAAKRTMQLRARQDELQGWYEEYVKNENDLKRLEGSMQAIEYVAFGKMPGDGNHDKFKDHTPQAYKEQIPERY